MPLKVYVPEEEIMKKTKIVVDSANKELCELTLGDLRSIYGGMTLANDQLSSAEKTTYLQSGGTEVPTPV